MNFAYWLSIGIKIGDDLQWLWTA